MNHLVRGERVRGINAIGYYVESIPASNVGIVGPFHSKPISAGMLNFEDFPYDVGVNSDICLTELLQPPGRPLWPDTDSQILFEQ
jgi:hypothetical protein